MREKDTLYRFVIESADVKGALVSLDSSWTDARGRVKYPKAIEQTLGHAFAAAILLSSTIKFEGKMTMQIRGEGPVHLLVVQVTADQKTRGLARWNKIPDSNSLSAMFGENARMTITIEATKRGEPYQGIVALSGASLVEALKNYFQNSEQLQTELVLSVNKDCAMGLLLQKLPAIDAKNLDNLDDALNAWKRTQTVAKSVADKQLYSMAPEQLLYQLFYPDQVRLFAGKSVAFECSCSQARTDGLIQSFGYAEAQAILDEQGSIDITCEFCDQVYQYGEKDIEELFASEAQESDPSGPTLH